MHLLHVQRQQREVGVVHVQHGAAGTVLEYIAGLEILPVQAGSLAVAALTNCLVGRQQTVDETPLFVLC